MAIHTNAHAHYLNSRILTAAPQKLHLMLIEGAAHQARLAKELWDVADRVAERDEAVMRCIDITGEMLLGIRDSDQAIARQVADVYAFLLRTVTEAKFLNDVAKLDDALRILEIERGTWQKVCEKFGDTRMHNYPIPENDQYVAAVERSAPSAIARGGAGTDFLTAGGVSLEA